VEEDKLEIKIENGSENDPEFHGGGLKVDALFEAFRKNA